MRPSERIEQAQAAATPVRGTVARVKGVVGQPLACLDRQ
jgi:hypothetical protein